MMCTKKGCRRDAPNVGSNQVSMIYKCSKGHITVVSDYTLAAPGDRPPRVAHARTTDPQTSHDAARKVDAGSLERRVVLALRDLGRANTKELADHMDVDKWSVSPRMKPLETKGLVRRTTERRDGQITWEVTDD